jgi:hypothetical protein
MAQKGEAMDKAKNQTKGLWIHRFTIQFFSVVLALLFYWLLGFVIDDIRSLPEPRYGDTEVRFLDPGLVREQKETAKKLEAISGNIEGLRKKQEELNDSTANLQKTMNQLMELRKLSLQKGVAQSGSEKKNLSESLSLFLENQKRYQEMSRNISLLNDQWNTLKARQNQTEEALAKQKKPAEAEFERLQRSHRHKLAFLELAFLIPLLSLAAFFIMKRHGGLYFPLFLAFGAATLLEVILTIHEYFPSRYFKYLLTLAAILAVVRLLVYVIKMVAFPKAQWLLKQYREAYERFFCPICEYPIRRGPLKYAFWDRRSLKKLSSQALAQNAGDDDPAYVCPACGAGLYGPCPSCKKTRHTLLPNCEHCGDQKEVISAG